MTLDEFIEMVNFGNALNGSTIDLRFTSITSEGVWNIAEVLKSGKAPSDLTINFSFNRISSEEVRNIAAVLKSGEAPSGLTLNFCCNNLSSGKVRDITEALKSGGAPSDLTINLSFNHIGSEEIRDIAQALKSGNAPNDLSIDLSSNNISSEQVWHIAEAIKSGNAPNDLTIDLGFNNIEREGAQHIAEALKSGNAPNDLNMDLCFNKIAQEGAWHIAEALQSGNAPNNLSIDLSYNNIGREGARYIAEALKSGSSPSGLSIDLSNNNFGLGGAQYIAEALESGGIPSGLTINLDNNYIPEIGIKAIYESLSILIKRNNTLLPKLNGSLEVFNLFKEDILKVILGGVAQDYWLDIESLFDQIDLSFNCFNFYTQEVPDELFKTVQGFLENTIKAKCMAASIDTDSTEIHDIQKLLKFWHNRIPDLDPKGRASCLIEVSALMPELSNKLALIQIAIDLIEGGQCRDEYQRLYELHFNSLLLNLENKEETYANRNQWQSRLNEHPYYQLARKKINDVVSCFEDLQPTTGSFCAFFNSGEKLAASCTYAYSDTSFKRDFPSI